MKLNFDEALQVCGNNNRYQKLFLITVILTWFSVDFVAIAFPLLELMPNFQCKGENGEWTDCLEEKVCSLPADDYRAIVKYSNILTDFNLYCDKTLVIMIGVVYTVGILVGAFLTSKTTDIYGRKPVLLVCQFLFSLGAILLTLAPNIYVLLVLLFFVGIACSGGTMLAYLYIFEVLSTAKRTIYGTLINSAFAIAGLIYFTAFKYLQNWRYLVYISTTADTIAGILILFYFTESPRFLLSKGETEKALKCLYKIAERNGKAKDFYKYLVSDISVTVEGCGNGKSSFSKDSPDDQTNINENKNKNNCKCSSDHETDQDLPSVSQKIFDEFVKGLIMPAKELTDDKEENLLGAPQDAEHPKKEAPFSALLKYKSLRYTFLICNLAWFTMAFTYYGISMGLKQSKDDIFIDGYVVYTAETISYSVVGVILSIAFFGRVRSLSIMFFISSISTFAYFFIKMYDLEPYDKILLFLARFGITSIYSIMYTYSTEVFPTVIRAKGLGVNTLFARFASILVPIVVELLNPNLIYASLCGVSFVLSMFLPETFGKELEDEIQEEKDQKKIHSEN